MRSRSSLVLLLLFLALAPSGTASADPAGVEDALNSKFQRYEPIYALVGEDGYKNAKFQISFRYNVYDHLYLGYLHTTVWDIGAPSAPFRDTSYRPTLFYHVNETGPQPGTPRAWLGAVVGGEHESNGKGGADSRSLNILYLKPLLTVERPGSLKLRIAPRLNYFTSVSGTNRDINEYRGHVDLQVIYDLLKELEPFDLPLLGEVRLFNKLQVAALVRKGTEKSRWTTQLDLSWSIGSLGSLYIQYFSGYGETLLEYTRRDTQARIGLMLQQW